MTALPEAMDIALRAWAVPEKRRKTGSGKKRRHRPKAFVVFDTETELGGSQDLIVGAYRYVRVEWKGSRPTLRCAEEGLFHPDDLFARDPAQLEKIRAYAARARADVDLSQRDANRSLQVLTRHEFCERMLWGACWRNRATLVGFNLGFDISRLRLSWHEGRGLYNGAFVLRLWEWEGKDHRYRPNVIARRLDNKRTLLAWSGVRDAPDDGDEHTSSDDHFLDLRTLLFAAHQPGSFVGIRERSLWPRLQETRRGPRRARRRPARLCARGRRRHLRGLPVRRLESSTATPCHSRRTGPTPRQLSAPPTSGVSGFARRWSEPRSQTPSWHSRWAPSTDLGSRSGSATSRFR